MFFLYIFLLFFIKRPIFFLLFFLEVRRFPRGPEAPGRAPDGLEVPRGPEIPRAPDDNPLFFIKMF